MLLQSWTAQKGREEIVQQDCRARAKNRDAPLNLEWADVFDHGNFSEGRANDCHKNIVRSYDEGLVELVEVLFGNKAVIRPANKTTVNDIPNTQQRKSRCGTWRRQMCSVTNQTARSFRWHHLP